MPLSFANVGLTPLHEHHELAAALWHDHRIDEWEFQTYLQPGTAAFPSPYPPKREAIQLGRLTWPTGADRWSTCHLVATGAQVSQLRSIIGTTPTAQELLITDGTTAGTIRTDMYLLPPRPICQKGTNEWYLLTLVDVRFYWHTCGSAEIPSPPGTWSEFLETLFGMVGVVPFIDPIPAAYLEPNALRWATGIQPIPIVIECVCKQIGMRTVRNLDGTVEVVTATSAQTTDASRWTAISPLVLNGGRLTGADIGRMVPSSVDVCFFDGNSGTTTPVNVTLASLGIAAYGGVTGVSAGTGRITADPLTTTAPQQTAYATQAATDYYNWLLGLTDATLRGIVNVDPEGLDDFVEWVHHPDMLVTRILRSQWADRNIYGELGPNYPNPHWIPGGGSGGSGGSGSGSGSGADGCTAAVNPVTVECEEGERVLRSTVIAVGVNSSGELVISQCETLDYPLGPCSPINPGGVTLPVAVMVCPIYATCLSLSASYQLLKDDWLIDVEGGNTITLPSSSTAGEGCWFVICNTGGGAVTIAASGGETINGVASIELTDDFSSALVFLSCSDATDWTAAILSGTPGGSGTVESVTVTTANGMQVSGGTSQTITTTGTFALTLPFTLAGSGTLTNSGVSSLTGFPGSGTSSGNNAGDQTITLTGDVTGSGTGTFAATIANDAVTNAQLANMAQATIKGRAAGAGTGDPTDLSSTQATAILDVATTSLKGLVGAGSTSHPNQPLYWSDQASYVKPLGRILGTAYAAASETTSSTTPVDLTTVQSVTFTLDTTSTVLFVLTANGANNTAAAVDRIYIYDGTTSTIVMGGQCVNANQNLPIAGQIEVTLGPGTYTYKMRYDTNAGTATFLRRMMTVYLAA